MDKGYVLGCDFGTQSLRVVLAGLRDGEAVAESVCEYPGGVLQEQLPYGTPLREKAVALQDARDYLSALELCVPRVLADSGVDRRRVRAIGLSATSCTIFPIDGGGEPLSGDPRFRDRPHAYAKLWKCHTAEADAALIEEAMRAHGHGLLERCGGAVSSEWFFPKILEVLHKDSEIFESAYTFVEAGDYVAYRLTGKLCRSSCMASSKAFYNLDEEAYPPPANKGKYIKIKYVTQLPNTQIPSFVFFANLPQYVREPYKRFLENKMREKWNMTGTPINIYIRQK